MAETPQFPDMPDVGDILDRKERFVLKKTTVLKCKECSDKYSREFTEGDYIFKQINDEECKECHRSKVLAVEEIYSEWIDPKITLKNKKNEKYKG
jgi:predicted RNA-binding protein